MTEYYKWKVIGILAAVAVSLYILVPTLFNLKSVADSEYAAPAGLARYFPKKGINLGLDLRGGLYLEMEVDLNEAVKNRVDVLITEIERILPQKDFPGLALARVAKTSRVRVFLPADKRSLFLDQLRENFGDVLDPVLAPTEINFQIAGGGDLADLLQKVAALLKEQNIPFADVERGGADNVLRIILGQPGTHEPVLQKIKASPLGASPLGTQLTPLPSSDYTVLQMTPEYVQHLHEMTLKQAVEAVRNRIDRYGVAEAGIQLQGEDRIIVEIPGVKNPDRVIDVIRKTGLLEFRLVDDSVESQAVSDHINEAREKNKIPEGYSKEIVDKINEGLKGKIPEDDEILFELTRDPITKEVVNGTPYLVKKRADVTGDMLRTAQVGVSQNEPHVNLSFNKIGAKNFGDITKSNVGKRMAIVLDGVVSSAPVIKEAILGGQAQITLGYGSYQSLLNEAEDLALLLREGALPASLTIATKTLIGPSLGADSIRSGINSMLFACAVIFLFMLGYYKLGGLLANMALILNVLFIFAILALFQASLTLPGIAGIVLTMGMAVDANVIIFERMREEKRLGKTAKSIVESGYEHAMSAIIDGNLTTLIAGIVLYQFGSGPIKGFATTLMIGILTTLTTAVVVTRVVYDYFIYKRRVNRIII
ncbi:MAG: protein translocase subunit SecD [Deltaproteobacteria bacterium]|nr:protein translocase subunit SecD [Deltaproteobacteria bacterium]